MPATAKLKHKLKIVSLSHNIPNRFTAAMASKKPSARSYDTTEAVGIPVKRQKVEVLPGEVDILFYGESNLTCRHSGNISFVQCVKRCLRQYCGADDMGKLTLCNGIVEGFAARLPSARFLMMRDTTSISRDWARLSKAEAIVVTAHAFISVLCQEEKVKIEAQQIDAMFVEEFASDPQEPAVSSTFGSANDREEDDCSNDLLTKDPDASSTTEVDMDADDVKVETQTEVKLSPIKHARRVSVDFKMTILPELDHHFTKRLPLLRRISETSQSDILKPISDRQTVDEDYWKVLNNNNFVKLKDVLDFDEEGLIP